MFDNIKNWMFSSDSFIVKGFNWIWGFIKGLGIIPQVSIGVIFLCILIWVFFFEDRR